MIIRAAWSRQLCQISSRRCFSSSLSVKSSSDKTLPPFAFAFDIDGVLIRGSKRLPTVQPALSYLHNHNIPYILLTNGGGSHERARAEKLTEELGVTIDPSAVIQSHSPYEELHEYKDKTVLIVGGRGDSCRKVAEEYGFRTAITPSDIFTQHPSVWPFSRVFRSYHADSAAPLPTPIDPANPSASLKIDAVFVYNDPRDWALDAQLILDCLLSQNGVLGTLSPKNGDPSLPNRGFQQDGQPPLYFSNPDLWFASEFALPRLGQGGFRAALEGVWAATTGGAGAGVELRKRVIGKPHAATYAFAERRLYERRRALRRGAEATPDAARFEKIYMVGDNPASDIAGANGYSGTNKTIWPSLLVKTGVFGGGTPAVKPTAVVDDVYRAVEWAVRDMGWAESLE